MIKNKLKRVLNLIMEDANAREMSRAQAGLSGDGGAEKLRTQVDFFMYGGGGKEDKNGELIFPPEWDKYMKIIDEEDMIENNT